MKILILNWRDVKNPDGGGAELLTQEMAKRWVKNGHQIVQFSSMFAGAKMEEMVDGVQIIRHGSSRMFSLGIPVHFAAFFWYIRYGRGNFDVVIDEIHGIPFFTPLYVKEKKIAFLCEVADNIWDIAFKFPLNILGKIVEHFYFYFYKQVLFLTISPSTKIDIIKKGISPLSITVLPIGLSRPDVFPDVPKEKNPTIIFVGRLTKAKGVEDAIRILPILIKYIRNVKLWIVGSGESKYEDSLMRLAASLGISDCIKFFGFVSFEKKFELMARAHVLVNPSIREGWGLTVAEAGIVGTPAVVYRVSGLIDLVHDGKNGLLVDPDAISLAAGVRRILVDKALYKTVHNGAKLEAKQHDWDKTAEVGLKILMK